MISFQSLKSFWRVTDVQQLFCLECPKHDLISKCVENTLAISVELLLPRKANHPPSGRDVCYTCLTLTWSHLKLHHKELQKIWGFHPVLPSMEMPAYLITSSPPNVTLPYTYQNCFYCLVTSRWYYAYYQDQPKTRLVRKKKTITPLISLLVYILYCPIPVGTTGICCWCNTCY